jgi:hypothetical protein
MSHPRKSTHMRDTIVSIEGSMDHKKILSGGKCSYEMEQATPQLVTQSKQPFASRHAPGMAFSAMKNTTDEFEVGHIVGRKSTTILGETKSQVELWANDGETDFAAQLVATFDAGGLHSQGFVSTTGGRTLEMSTRPNVGPAGPTSASIGMWTEGVLSIVNGTTTPSSNWFSILQPKNGATVPSDRITVSEHGVGIDCWADATHHAAGEKLVINTGVFIEGDVAVTGHIEAATLNVSGTKLFLMDHPVRENYRLAYVCPEGPKPQLQYTGKVTTDAAGLATVNLDEVNHLTTGTFEALMLPDSLVCFLQSSSKGYTPIYTYENAVLTITGKASTQIDYLVYVTRGETGFEQPITERPGKRRKYNPPQLTRPGGGPPTPPPPPPTLQRQQATMGEDETKDV